MFKPLKFFFYNSKSELMNEVFGIRKYRKSELTIESHNVTAIHIHCQQSSKKKQQQQMIATLSHSLCSHILLFSVSHSQHIYSLCKCKMQEAMQIANQMLI